MIPSYKDDEANTRTQTVLLMRIGGGTAGGIHGAHLGPGIQIRYAAADKKRQTIPWVEYKNAQTGASRTYLATGTADSVRSLPVFEMQCVDCHNRASHAFELPERAVNQAMADGQIAASLPFVKKKQLSFSRPVTQAATKLRKRFLVPSARSIFKNTPTSRPSRDLKSTQPDKPWPRSISATFSPISRLPGERIQTISATPTIRAASAATTKGTLRPTKKPSHRTAVCATSRWRWTNLRLIF